MTARRKAPMGDVLFVRVSAAERRAIANAAKEAGFRSDSEWVRVVLKKVIERVDLSLR